MTARPPGGAATEESFFCYDQLIGRHDDACMAACALHGTAPDTFFLQNFHLSRKLFSICFVTKAYLSTSYVWQISTSVNYDFYLSPGI
jgi:hypothetical protein